jgi:phage tail protein X
MTIPTNSRYATGVSVSTVNANGVVELGVMRTPPLGYSSFLHYQTVYGDRLDTLAYRFFADPTLWWIIADANPGIVYPQPIPVGSILAIPRA